jgi:hypothetical protein
MALSAARRRPGPQPKGTRSQFTLRLPADHAAHYKREAEAEGLSLADYFAVVLARGHGLPEPEYVTRVRLRDQDELPLTGTG